MTHILFLRNCSTYINNDSNRNAISWGPLYQHHIFTRLLKLKNNNKAIKTLIKLSRWIRLQSIIIGWLDTSAGLNLNRKLPILFIGDAWCLSILVLINVYTSLLTSYMTARNPKPLVKCAQELRDRSNV